MPAQSNTFARGSPGTGPSAAGARVLWSRTIAKRIERAGASFIDGSALEPNVIGAEPGQSAALTMAFAAWT